MKNNRMIAAASVMAVGASIAASSVSHEAFLPKRAYRTIHKRGNFMKNKRAQMKKNKSKK